MSDESSDAAEILEVATDLRAIEDLEAATADQAVHKANHWLMPGGEAMVMRGPVADPEAHENRVAAAEEWNLNREDDDLPPRDLSHLADEDDVWEPPLQTLLFWSERWRYEHGKVTDLRPTIASEAAFLRQLLGWVYEHEPKWRDFARDIKAARYRIENTLRAGEREERTGVPCVDCRTPRLVKVYGPAEKDDHFACPRCKRTYSSDDYNRAKYRHLASQEANRYVKLRDAMQAIDRPERTFRQWMHDNRIRAYCALTTHQVWVWWPDVRELDINQPRRQRDAA